MAVETLIRLVFSQEFTNFLQRERVTATALSKKIDARAKTISAWIDGSSFPNTHSRDQLEWIGFDANKYTSKEFTDWIYSKYEEGAEINEIALLI